MKVTKLYLGLSRKIGDDISREELKLFFREFVTPQFESFTIYDVTGFWKGEMEDTVVLEIIHESDLAHEDWAIECIAKNYCTVFDQDAVYRTDIDADAHLVERMFGERDEGGSKPMPTTTKKDRTEGNFNVHPAISPILEKLKHNTPWPGQTEVIETRIPEEVLEEEALYNDLDEMEREMIDSPKTAKLAFQKAYEGCLNGLRDYGFDIEFDDVVYFEFDEDCGNMYDPYPEWVISAMDLVQNYFKLYKEI